MELCATIFLSFLLIKVTALQCLSSLCVSASVGEPTVYIIMSNYLNEYTSDCEIPHNCSSEHMKQCYLHLTELQFSKQQSGPRDLLCQDFPNNLFHQEVAKMVG